MEKPKIRKSRASSSDQARQYRQQGYDDALEFALSIGLTSDYKNNPQAKKDVIDPSGDAHSVKSGKKKWQVFLYGLGRFESDEAFVVMNGVGELLKDCINAFPSTYDQYKRDKNSAKERLKIPMVKLKDKLQEKSRLRAFVNKSLFNGGEVNYLTVKQDGEFHVFLNNDVVKTMGEQLEVCNSRALLPGQYSDQKVLFRYKGKNLGELEMRNESPIHYREVRFNMIKPKVMKLLFEHLPMTRKFNDQVFVYGNASKHFGRWSQLTSETLAIRSPKS